MIVFAGRMLPKKLAVDRRDPLPILYADQQNSCSGHVRKLAAQAFNGGLDNFETPSRLTRCIASRDRLAIFAEWGCPVTAMIRPDRTAREIPTFGSKGDPVRRVAVGCSKRSSRKLNVIFINNQSRSVRTFRAKVCAERGENQHWSKRDSLETVARADDFSNPVSGLRHSHPGR